MKFTGERFVPEVQGNIQLEHVHRYLQACSLAANKVVLDIASGEGYGSSMLAEVALQVYGVDISEEAVKHASARYQSSNLEFRVGNCASIPLPDSSVDFVVSFETIEHHEQHEEMMLELRRVLKEDGVLLISSPDKLYYSDLPASHNEYHVKELYESEFKLLLESHFSSCAYFGQRIVYGSGIFPENVEANIGFQFQTYQQTDHGIQASNGMAQPLYWIALASMQALPSISAGLFEQPQKSSEMVVSLQTTLSHREQDNSLQKNWIQHLEADILVLKEALVDAEVKQEQWKKQVDSLTQHLEQSESQLADVKQDIVKQERYMQQEFSRLNDARENTLAKWHQTLQELTQIQGQMSEREQQLQQQQHDCFKANEANLNLREQLALLEMKLVEQASIANQIQEEQNNKLIQQESQLVTICHERDAALAQYSHLRASTSWRMTSPLRAIGQVFRGNLSPFKFGLRALGHKLVRAIPTSVKGGFKRAWSKFLNVTALMPHSSMNQAAVANLVEERNEIRPLSVLVPPLLQVENCPTIDINAVTYNNGKWLDGFVRSLLALNYPKSCLRVYFVDNASTDNTPEKLQEVATVLREQHIFVEILSKPNRGFGAGHNAAIAAGKSEFFLITNVDLEFETDALLNVVSAAIADVSTAAAWELRQKPYEHPKYYDPITGSTNWNAYACVLLRRSALQKVGGFDETLFMYGEDVELSYRLRRAGFILRYCPRAVVWHFTYESAGQTKRLQYAGSTFANLYLRLKYGNRWDVLAVPLMGLRLLLAPQAYSGARRDIFFNWLKLTWLLPKTLLGRRASSVSFPFREWDYEMIRDGAFLNLQKIPHDAPLVSVVTRTYAGREHYLRQAIISVARQTYPNIEHIIVEDGGTSMQALIEEMQNGIDRPLRFFGLHKCGRSATGNHGMEQSRGRWCVFLDDDDLLFSDHVEVLVNTLLQQPESVAAYTLAWEVVTDSAKLIDGEYIEHTYKVPTALRQTFDYDVLRHHNFMPIQSVLFERSLFEERGGFDEDMDALEDWTLWVRYAHGNVFAHVPKLTSLFRTPFSEDSIRQRVVAFGDAYPLALARHDAQTKAIDAAQGSKISVNQRSNEQDELIS